MLRVAFKQLQSKRELFFKNELPSGGAVPPAVPAGPPTPAAAAPTVTPSILKEALAKRNASTERGDFSNIKLLPYIIKSFLTIFERELLLKV